MSEESRLLSSRWPVVPGAATDWLLELCGDGLTGFMPPAMPDPVVPEGMNPCYRCFPSATKDGSWPLGLIPPTEGSLDRETWYRLIEILTSHSSAGPDTRCLAYDNPIVLGSVDFENPHVRAGRLGDAGLLYDESETDFSPANLWAEDRSWVVCTDYDLWGSKVAGPSALVEALLGDGEIEAVRLPWAH